MKELKTIRGMPDLFGSQIQGISFVEKTCEKSSKVLIFRSSGRLFWKIKAFLKGL